MPEEKIPVKTILAELEKRKQILEGIDKTVQSYLKEAESEKTEFSGLTEAYAKIVKLANVKPDPKCVAAIKKAESAPSQATIAAARKEIEAFAATQLKANGKSKEIIQLKANVESLSSEMKMVLDADPEG